jgi:predicted anti-sigma-YlaC factor YlaD
MSAKTNRIQSAIHRVLGWLAFSCHDMSRLSSQALDSRLPWVTRARMSVHWLICKWCRRYRKQIALLRRACSSLGIAPPDSGPALPPEARERIRQRLCEHDGH